MDAKVIKMKDSVPCRYPQNLLLALILTFNLAVTSGTDSFSKQTTKIQTSHDYVQLINAAVPVLKDFTICVDIYPETSPRFWTVFTYREGDPSDKALLGLVGSAKALKIYHLGNIYEFDYELPLSFWHSVCLAWNGLTRKMEAYVNGSSVYTITSGNFIQMKGNGTLVLGINHSVQGGGIIPADVYNFIGNIYNFQLWDYKRPTGSLNDCSNGNIANWTRSMWKFNEDRLIEDKNLRCAQKEDMLTTAGATTARTSLGSSTTLLTTTKVSKGSTTSQLEQSEGMPKTSIFPTNNGMSTTHYSAFSLASTTSEPNSSETRTTLGSPEQSTSNTTALEFYTTSESPSHQTPEPTSSENNATTLSLPEPTAGATSSEVTTAPLPDRSSATSTEPPAGNLPSTSDVSTNIFNGTTTTTEPLLESTIKTSTMDTSSSAVTTKVLVSLVTTFSEPSTITVADESEETSVSKPSTVTSTVTFYMLLMDISILSPNGIVDLEAVANATKNLISLILKDTEFFVVQFNIEDGLSNEPWNSQSQKRNRKRREITEDSVDFNKESKAIIRAISPDPPESLAVKLEKLMESQDYSNAEFTLNLSVVYVQIIVPGTCPPQSTFSSDKGVYKWPKANPTETARAPCAKNSKTEATRYCNINIITEKAMWENPNLERCPSFDPLPNSIQDLQSIPVTPANAVYMAMHICNITSNSGPISKEDTDIILSKVYDIVEMGETDLDVAKTTLDIIDSILVKAVSLREFTNRILNLTEEIGYEMYFPGPEENITAQTLAVLVTKVNFTEFKEMFFTVTSYVDGMIPEITLERVPTDEAVAFIHLPGSVQDHTATSTATVQFNFFGKRSLFEDSGQDNIILNTYVVSASVDNTRIQGLKDPVDITLKHISQNTKGLPVHCVFWDFHTNNGRGGWNATGCNATLTNENYTTCHCSHLTHFGVLLDLSRSEINALDWHILSILTYAGCGIASLFLGITLVTYCVFKKLRRDYPSKILMNLSSALFMLNLVFLLNTWLSSFRIYGLCISSAALLHYLLLASFTWMGLEAVHMYFAFVKVFNLYIHNYILKFCVAGWGIPAIIVAIVLVIDLDFYGSDSDYTHYTVSQDNSELFCWIQNDIVFYITVVAYFCAMFLTNITMFIVVLIQINSLKYKKKKDWRSLFLHDVKSTISIAFLLGITWGFAFFAWGPVRIAFLYLFSIFNTLQGFFIFVFHCLMKENVRRQWRMHLCCGKFRLDNYSDWSKLSNAEAKHTSGIRTSPSDSFQSTRSNTTASTSNASSLSRDEFIGKSFVNGGIFMSSAQMAPPNRAAIHPDTRGILSFLDLDVQ